MVIAAPDHCNAPSFVLGHEAGKHVYVEKACSPITLNEGEILGAGS